MGGTITVCTQVYNAKPFLARCVESVLRQIYSNFEYILIDNGSTDGCKELLEAYAKQDARIKLVRIEKNTPKAIWMPVVREKGQGEYITNVDSDDWLNPTYLERLVSLAEQYQLDIVCTGTTFHMEGQENIPSGTRSFLQQIVIDKPQFAAYFPYYHVFFRPMWGKLVRKAVFQAADYSQIERKGLSNGADTLTAFAWLRQAKRICIDNSVLHHYLLRNKSISHIYLPNRFKSNTVLHQDAVDFLSQYGPVSEQNLHFLHIVYANAVHDTLEVLWNSDLSPDEKLTEYCTIVVHPTTREAYQDTDAAIDRSRNRLLQQFLITAAQAQKEPKTFSDALQMLLPKCSRAIIAGVMPLFRREPHLMDALMQDDPNQLAEGLLDLIAAKRYTKQYNLGKMICALAADNLLLCGIDDVQFIRKYRSSYWSIWQGNTLDALDEMTGMLMEGRVQGAGEAFLTLYLSVAAQLEQIPAFIFGKIRLAEFYLNRKRTDDCKSVLDELAEMGAQDNEEVVQMHRQLEKLL